MKLHRTEQQIINDFNIQLGYLWYELNEPKELTNLDIDKFMELTDEEAKRSFVELKKQIGINT